MPETPEFPFSPAFANSWTGAIGALVPIVTVLAVAAVVALSSYLRHRIRIEVQQTVRAAIEHGQALTPELLERLGEPPRTREADLRRGVMALAVGLGIVAFGALLGDEEAFDSLLAIGAVPALIGIAYLAVWRLMPRR